MPELKRNFLKGKMNKDLDERLVPSGSYRDAVNIEVETSEDSNSGSVQTLKGNVISNNVTSPGSYKSITVGSFVDNANNKIYNFIHKASDFSNDSSNSYNGYARSRGVRSDVIQELSPNSSLNASTSSLVFVDVYEARASLSSQILEDQTVITLNNDPTSPNYCGFQNVEDSTGSYRSPLKVGMRIQAVRTDGFDNWSGNFVVVKALGVFQNTTTVTFSKIENVSNPLDTDAINSGVILKFTSDRVLNFYAGKYQEKEINTSQGQTTYTPEYSMITSINKIDDLLLFTDGRTEPKKINVPRFKRGTINNITIPTKLYVYIDQKYIGATATPNSTFFQGIANADESHITVIKKNPETPIKVKCNVNETDFANLLVPVLGKGDLTEDSFQPFALSNNANVKYNIGQYFYIKPVTSSIVYEVDDMLKLVGQDSATVVFVRIDSITEDPASGGNYYTVALQTDDEDYVGTEEDEVWVASIAVKQNIYKDVFVNFAYRYTYSDGQKSCISPYSKTAFLPGLYSYNSKNGFNLGMENQSSSIDLSEFIPFNIPLDVTEVEILFKTSKSENVYVAKSIKRRSSDFNFNETSVLSPNGKITLQDELFGSALPSNQLTRNFDAVPKKAITQEIMANRLMFGNYYEDYDLKDTSDENINVSLDVEHESNNYAFFNSFNSTNNIMLFPNFGVSQAGWAVNYTYGATIFPSSISAGTVSSPLAFEIEYDPGNNYNGGTAAGIANHTFHYTLPYVTNATDVHTYSFDIELIVKNTGGVTQPRYKIGIYYSDGSATPGALITESEEFGGGDGNDFDFFERPGDGFLVQGIQMNYSGTFSLPSGPEGSQNKICFALKSLDAVSDLVVIRPLLIGGKIEINESPDSVNAIQATQGIESVKTDRFYQVGVVYRDKYGRESSVLLDESFNFQVPISKSGKQNLITAKINNQAPSWAETYKFFIKETTQRYNNLVLEAAFENNDGEFAWLVFNSVDRNKVKVGDTLILKKKQALNEAVTSPDANWKIIDIQDNGTVNEEAGTLLVQGTQISEAVIASASELIGKFFVKVNLDSFFTTYIGDITTTPIVSAGNYNGAVFETKPSQLVDLDLYYEASQAYPIKLNRENLGTYIKPNARVEIDPSGSNIAQQIVDAFNSIIHRVNKFPQTMVGASSFGSFQVNENIATGNDGFAKISVLQENLLPPNVIIPAGTVLRFVEEDNSYVTAKLAKDTNGSNFYLIPFTHNTNQNSTYSTKIRLPWFNCYAFGNGVESDTIRDDFNEGTIYPYAASGKQSGFKANIPLDVYKERHRKHDIIFSSIYNDKSDLNKLNEFILAENIVKSINPEYGSIQKLYSRNNDLVTICEDKCLKVLSKKDALYNADGNSQLLSSTNVLGEAIPFTGDYGISKNPESFAVDEYRIYFVDKARGSVLRLSNDGLTPISDYGMEDWFNDNLKNASAIIGGFDGKKEEYNVTIHETIVKGSTKNVYTLSFNESSNGWVSFKSFIPESCLTINNGFYTFKNGILYKHHISKQDNNLPVGANNFYGNSYTSSVTAIFNEAPDIVKSFSTISYEGSQSKVNQFTNVLFEGNNVNDNEYYNAESIKGWYLESINTDLQEGEITEFIKKENKWHNYIKGIPTSYTNNFEGSQLNNNLDLSEFSVQGIGEILNVQLEAGAQTPSQGISITIEVE